MNVYLFCLDNKILSFTLILCLHCLIFAGFRFCRRFCFCFKIWLIYKKKDFEKRCVTNSLQGFLDPKINLIEEIFYVNKIIRFFQGVYFITCLKICDTSGFIITSSRVLYISEAKLINGIRIIKEPFTLKFYPEIFPPSLNVKKIWI